MLSTRSPTCRHVSLTERFCAARIQCLILAKAWSIGLRPGGQGGRNQSLAPASPSPAAAATTSPPKKPQLRTGRQPRGLGPRHEPLQQPAHADAGLRPASILSHNLTLAGIPNDSIKRGNALAACPTAPSLCRKRHRRLVRCADVRRRGGRRIRNAPGAARPVSRRGAPVPPVDAPSRPRHRPRC